MFNCVEGMWRDKSAYDWFCTTRSRCSLMLMFIRAVKISSNVNDALNLVTMLAEPMVNLRRMLSNFIGCITLFSPWAVTIFAKVYILDVRCHLTWHHFHVLKCPHKVTHQVNCQHFPAAWKCLILWTAKGHVMLLLPLDLTSLVAILISRNFRQQMLTISYIKLCFLQWLVSCVMYQFRELNWILSGQYIFLVLCDVKREISIVISTFECE